MATKASVNFIYFFNSVRTYLDVLVVDLEVWSRKVKNIAGADKQSLNVWFIVGCYVGRRQELLGCLCNPLSTFIYAPIIQMAYHTTGVAQESKCEGVGAC